MGTRVGFKWFLSPNINSESCSQPEPHACWHQKLSARRNHAWGKAEVTQLSFAEPDTQSNWWHGYSQPDIDRGDAPPTPTTYLVFWDKPYSASSGVVFLQHEWGRNEANGSMSGLISFHFKAEEVTASCLFVCFFKRHFEICFSELWALFRIPLKSYWKQSMLGKKWIPMDVHILIPIICDYVTLHGKKDFADEIKDLEMGK